MQFSQIQIVMPQRFSLIFSNKLESIIVDMTGINTMQLSQVAITPKNPIKPNKRRIVLLAFISGFMMSILLALFMEILKPYEKNST